MKIFLFYALITIICIIVLQPKNKSKIILFSVFMPLIGLIVFCLFTLLVTRSAFLVGEAIGQSIYAVPISMVLIYLILSDKLEKEETKNKEVGDGSAKTQDSEFNQEDK